MKNKSANLTKQTLEIPQEIAKQLKGADAFLMLLNMPGKAFRAVRGRKTVQVKLGENSYFIKQHFGVGWVEIFKNLLTFKKPIISARTEKLAIEKLTDIGIPTTPLVAFGERGCNPATRQSFLMTQDLGDIVSLEDIFTNNEGFSVTAQSKLMMLTAVAKLAATLHSAGLCHRDFYLCHFVLSRQDAVVNRYNLYLIDLHRMLQNQPSNGRAVMKDVAGLYFSMLQNGLKAKDLNIFKQHYLPQRADFWKEVETRANKLLTKFNGAKFQKRLDKEKSAVR